MRRAVTEPMAEFFCHLFRARPKLYRICNNPLAGGQTGSGQNPARGDSHLAVSPMRPAVAFQPERYPSHTRFLAAVMSSRDSEKIGRLYLDEGERLERQIARRIGNRSIARDLVHDIFLRFCERAGELRGNPSAFMARSARNIAIDHLRREKLRSAHAATGCTQFAPGDPAFDALLARQSGDAVRNAIQNLPKTTRRLFLMNRVQGLTFQEIASICGMSERNVAKHMAKAVAHCARALEDVQSE